MSLLHELLPTARRWLQAREPIVWVQITAVRGSTPRNVGATLLVSADRQAGSIGGGALEYQATTEARELLRRLHEHGDSAPQRRQCVLGADCGQCCGGVVELAYHTLQKLPDWFTHASLATTGPTVAVFGAGHVGSAIVDLLCHLDVQIIWIDSRAGQLPAAVSAEHADRLLLAPQPRPVEFVRHLPAHSLCLVMTHNHSLDFELCSALLARTDVAFCGLIGSRSKRLRFERLLRQNGQLESASRLICPIGVGEVAGKRPYEIAIAVCAQILQRVSHLPQVQSEAVLIDALIDADARQEGAHAGLSP